ncbi:hypothetical protein BSKO_05359 [Bryopsis sp. KO-2023]|nr:hypothetical protein BSKO_05359 [Bryopsis sp. KO-2023]
MASRTVVLCLLFLCLIALVQSHVHAEVTEVQDRQQAMTSLTRRLLGRRSGRKKSGRKKSGRRKGGLSREFSDFMAKYAEQFD